MTLTRDQMMDKVLSSPFMGRWREAPEGLHKRFTSPFMGRWRAAPEGPLKLPLPLGERVGVRGLTLPLPLGERVGVRGLSWK